MSRPTVFRPWMGGLVVLSFLLAGWVQPPSAQQAPRGGYGPCNEDVKKLCGDVKPGQGRVVRCLHEKEAQVSPACKDSLQQRRAEFREARQACHDDVARFCKGIRPGQGRVAACLKSHEAELSPACKADLPQK